MLDIQSAALHKSLTVAYADKQHVMTVPSLWYLTIYGSTRAFLYDYQVNLHAGLQFPSRPVTGRCMLYRQSILRKPCSLSIAGWSFRQQHLRGTQPHCVSTKSSLSVVRSHLAVIMCHLQSCSLEAALHVKAFVCFRTVQYGLVTAHIFGNVVQRLDYSETKLLALLVFCNCDVFDVTNETQMVDAAEHFSLCFGGTLPYDLQFPLDYQCSCAHYFTLAVQNDQHMVATCASPHLIESCLELFLGYISNMRQDSQDIEEAVVEVGSS